MKTSLIVLIIFLSLVSCDNIRKPVVLNNGKPANQFVDSTDMTNNFYDNVETNPLPLKDIYIGGEIANPGKVIQDICAC